MANAKEKFFKEMKSAPLMSPRMTRKSYFLWQPSFCPPGESFIGLDTSNQPQHALSQSLIQNEALTLFDSLKAERSEDTAKGASEASGGWPMRFKERSRLHDTKVQAKQKVLIRSRSKVSGRSTYAA